MKILDNTKSLSVLVNDSTNGIGQISPISAFVEEQLNGIYEAEMTVSIDEPMYSELSVGSLILMPVDDTDNLQIFEIYFIGKEIGGVSDIKLQHITYKLSKVPVAPFTASGAVNVCNQMINNIIGTYPFSMSTNISNTTSTFTLDIPRSFRECLGGYEGSILDTFRGEYKWDNLNVGMLSRRGADNNVRIAYGKNLTDFRQEENIENVYDGVFGYAVVDDVTYTASSVYNKTGATQPRVLLQDFSSDYESGDIPTSAELLQKATDYATNNDIEVPSVNITISFVPLYQTEEYKNILPLERVSLGDTVHVYFEKLGVEASARVIKTKWNCLLNKYEEIELGSARANLNSVINSSAESIVDEKLKDIDIDTSDIEKEMKDLSQLIANGLGLHITQDSLGRIILHNEETIASSQYQYLISANGFMLSEDYGQTWKSGWTTSGQAVLNSLSTITLRALEIYGSYIEGSQILFGDSSNKYILAQVYNDGTNDIGVTFDGTGTIRMKPQTEFLVKNESEDGTYKYNDVILHHDDSYNYIYLENSVGEADDYGTGNTIKMTSQKLSSSYRNYLDLTNYKEYTSGTFSEANQISLSVRSNLWNVIDVTNYCYDNTNKANKIYLNSDAFGQNDLYLQNNDTSGNIANQIYLSSNSNGTNELHLRNYDTSGNTINYLSFDGNGYMTLWSPYAKLWTTYETEYSKYKTYLTTASNIVASNPGWYGSYSLILATRYGGDIVLLGNRVIVGKTEWYQDNGYIKYRAISQ